MINHTLDNNNNNNLNYGDYNHQYYQSQSQYQSHHEKSNINEKIFASNNSSIGSCKNTNNNNSNSNGNDNDNNVLEPINLNYQDIAQRRKLLMNNKNMDNILKNQLNKSVSTIHSFRNKTDDMLINTLNNSLNNSSFNILGILESRDSTSNNNNNNNNHHHRHHIDLSNSSGHNPLSNNIDSICNNGKNLNGSIYGSFNANSSNQGSHSYGSIDGIGSNDENKIPSKKSESISSSLSALPKKSSGATTPAIITNCFDNLRIDLDIESKSRKLEKNTTTPIFNSSYSTNAINDDSTTTNIANISKSCINLISDKINAKSTERKGIKQIEQTYQKMLSLTQSQIEKMQEIYKKLDKQKEDLTGIEQEINLNYQKSLTDLEGKYKEAISKLEQVYLQHIEEIKKLQTEKLKSIKDKVEKETQKTRDIMDMITTMENKIQKESMLHYISTFESKFKIMQECIEKHDIDHDKHDSKMINELKQFPIIDFEASLAKCNKNDVDKKNDLEKTMMMINKLDAQKSIDGGGGGGGCDSDCGFDQINVKRANNEDNWLKTPNKDLDADISQKLDLLRKKKEEIIKRSTQKLDYNQSSYSPNDQDHILSRKLLALSTTTSLIDLKAKKNSLLASQVKVPNIDLEGFANGVIDQKNDISKNETPIKNGANQRYSIAISRISACGMNELSYLKDGNNNTDIFSKEENNRDSIGYKTPTYDEKYTNNNSLIIDGGKSQDKKENSRYDNKSDHQKREKKKTYKQVIKKLEEESLRKDQIIKKMIRSYKELEEIYKSSNKKHDYSRCIDYAKSIDIPYLHNDNEDNDEYEQDNNITMKGNIDNISSKKYSSSCKTTARNELIVNNYQQYNCNEENGYHQENYMGPSKENFNKNYTQSKGIKLDDCSSSSIKPNRVLQNHNEYTENLIEYPHEHELFLTKKKSQTNDLDDTNNKKHNSIKKHSSSVYPNHSIQLRRRQNESDVIDYKSINNINTNLSLVYHNDTTHYPQYPTKKHDSLASSSLLHMKTYSQEKYRDDSNNTSNNSILGYSRASIRGHSHVDLVNKAHHERKEYSIGLTNRRKNQKSTDEEKKKIRIYLPLENQMNPNCFEISVKKHKTVNDLLQKVLRRLKVDDIRYTKYYFSVKLHQLSKEKPMPGNHKVWSYIDLTKDCTRQPQYKYSNQQQQYYEWPKIYLRILDDQ